MPFSTAPAPKSGILDIAPYVGGKSKIAGIAEPIKLSSNENALGTSKMAIEAYQAICETLFRYPDGHAQALRAVVADYHGLDPARLLFGNGSDEVFALLNQTYLEVGDTMVTGAHGFLAYRISALACQAEVRLADEPDYCISPEVLLSKVDERTRLVYVSNPGNPTGTCLGFDEMARLREILPQNILLVIDEAYAEFVDMPGWQSAFDLAHRLDNVVVTRTFSKIFGLGGMRIGFGYCPQNVVDACDRIRLPFNINIAAQAAASAALHDRAHTKASRELVLNWRPRFTQRLRALGFETTDSQGNFVLMLCRDQAEAVAMNEHLIACGLIVRHVANYGLPRGLRITIGKDVENETVLSAIEAFRRS